MRWPPRSAFSQSALALAKGMFELVPAYRLQLPLNTVRPCLPRPQAVFTQGMPNMPGSGIVGFIRLFFKPLVSNCSLRPLRSLLGGWLAGLQAFLMHPFCPQVMQVQYDTTWAKNDTVTYLGGASLPALRLLHPCHAGALPSPSLAQQYEPRGQPALSAATGPPPMLLLLLPLGTLQGMSSPSCCESGV